MSTGMGVGKNHLFISLKWKVYHTTEHLPRTNNAIGFHRAFESMLQINKPNVWKLLEVIHRQRALREFTFAKQK